MAFFENNTLYTIIKNEIDYFLENQVSELLRSQTSAELIELHSQHKANYIDMLSAKELQFALTQIDPDDRLKLDEFLYEQAQSVINQFLKHRLLIILRANFGYNHEDMLQQGQEFTHLYIPMNTTGYQQLLLENQQMLTLTHNGPIHFDSVQEIMEHQHKARLHKSKIKAKEYQTTDLYYAAIHLTELYVIKRYSNMRPFLQQHESLAAMVYKTDIGRSTANARQLIKLFRSHLSLISHQRQLEQIFNNIINKVYSPVTMPNGEALQAPVDFETLPELFKTLLELFKPSDNGDNKTVRPRLGGRQ